MLNKSIAVFLGLIVSSGVSAQPLPVEPTPELKDERFEPRSIPQQEKPAVEVQEKDEVPDRETIRNKILVESLRSLHVTQDLQPLPPQEKSASSDKGVSVDQLNVPEKSAFIDSLKPFLGKPVSLALLDEINRHIIRWYRDRDYPVVDALAPGGQDITEGDIQISVLVAKRGELVTKGGEYFDNQDIEEQFRIKAGEPLRYSYLQQELDWINRNPFRSVGLQLAPGQEPGSTDLHFQVRDRVPVRVYTGVEDTGNQFTGHARWLAGINWGNVFGAGHQLGYQYMSAEHSARLYGHSLSYTADLASRHRVSVHGSYVRTNPELDKLFDQVSRTKSAGINYRIPLLLSGVSQASWSLGYDYIRSNSNLDFGGQTVFDNEYVVSRFSLGSQFNWQHEKSVSGLGLTLNASPGSMLNDNNDQAFAASRFGARAEYAYLTLDASHYRSLSRRFSFNSELKVQAADANLVSSEQFGIGGYASVRGYNEYALIGDHGGWWRNEILLDAGRPAQALFDEGIEEKLQWLAFFDIGMVKIKNTLPQEPKTQRLRSAGIGLRYQLSQHLSLRLDHGWQLKELMGQKRDHRGHFSLMLSY